MSSSENIHSVGEHNSVINAFENLNFDSFGNINPLNNINIDPSGNINPLNNINTDPSKNKNLYGKYLPTYFMDSDFDSNAGSDIESENDSNNDILNEDQNNAISLSTNGFLYDDDNYKNLAHATKKKIILCDICEKLYMGDMIIDIICYHCFFWLNYDVSLRNNADDTNHLTIVEYIIKCKDDHDTSKCTRNTDKGGCFLCDYKLGIPIIDIKNAKLIYEEEEKDIIIENDDITDDIIDVQKIVIEL